MKAKFVYEAMGDVLKPKTEKEIKEIQWSQDKMEGKITKSKLYEMFIEDVKIKDVVNKNLLDDWMADSFKNELFMYTYADEHGLNPEEMDVEEWIETDEAKNWIEYEIESKFYETINKFRYDIIYGNAILIWRKMSVCPKEWLKELDKKQRLGIYWSWDPKAAEEHWGYADNMDLALIESSIEIDHINWIDTIRANMDPGAEDEKEIRLFKNTPLKINKLWINNEEVDITFIKNKIFKA